MGSNAAELARLVAEGLDERKGRRIVALDLTDLTLVTDYFVICSGTSHAHMQGLADRVEEKLEREGIRLLHREGTDKAGWVLLDYGDVVVHIFDEESREFYNLERLWGDAKTVEMPAAQAAGR
ncbi:MAG: ribosome silencing factor [Bacillota bacterium]